MNRAFFAILGGLILAACSQENVVSNDENAHSAASLVPAQDGIGIAHGRVNPLLGGRNVTAAFFDIISDQNDQLVAVSAQDVETVELHTHIMKDGEMLMQQVKSVDLPEGEVISFKPRGLHLMMFGVPAIEEGDKIQFLLEFSSGRTKTVSFPVASATGNTAHQH